MNTPKLLNFISNLGFPCLRAVNYDDKAFTDFTDNLTDCQNPKRHPKVTAL